MFRSNCGDILKRRRALVLLASYVLFANLGFAEQTEPKKQKFTVPAEVSIAGDAVLITTHHSRTWDRDALTKKPADETIRYAKENRIGRIYLQDVTDSPDYYCEDKEPTYIVKSTEGLFDFEIPASKVISTGGNLAECHMLTMNRLLYKWRDSKKNLAIVLVVPALYAHSDGRAFSDYYNKDDKSLTVEQWTRVRDELEKLKQNSHLNQYGVPLSTALNFFPSDEASLGFLTHHVKTWFDTTRFLPDHGVVVRYRGREMTLRKKPRDDSPEIAFDFVNPIGNESIADSVNAALKRN